MDEEIRESILLGRWTWDALQSLLNEASRIKDAGKRIEFLSGHFLEIPYKESTLIGDKNTPEVFVINLEGIDCFTFIDYIEALRLSAYFSEFKENLRRVRYKAGKVAFENRNHFFTDWVESNSEFVEDVTEGIGGKNAIKVEKMLNAKEDGTYFLNGVDPKQRIFKYIPSAAIDNSIMNKLRTGDYAGIYSYAHGLDVSHVGIIIKDSERVYLRHASSVKGEVVDEDLKKYMYDKLGLIVLRAKNEGVV